MRIFSIVLFALSSSEVTLLSSSLYLAAASRALRGEGDDFSGGASCSYCALLEGDDSSAGSPEGPAGLFGEDSGSAMLASI